MTSVSTKAAMTTTDDELRRERIAELQRRRAAGSNSTESRSVATVESNEDPRSRSRVESMRVGVGSGSKIAATGIGFTAMLGLVAAMGYAGRTSASESTPEPTVPTQVVVVLHPAEGGGSTSAADGAAPATNEPIALTAQPVVRQAPASDAPTGRTNGSR